MSAAPVLFRPGTHPRRQPRPSETWRSPEEWAAFEEPEFEDEACPNIVPLSGRLTGPYPAEVDMTDHPWTLNEANHR